MLDPTHAHDDFSAARGSSHARRRQEEKDDFFFGMAKYIAHASGDLTTKCGAVVVHPDDGAVLSIGWNDFPRKVKDLPRRRERPEKYLFTEHSERNAFYNAARHGIRLMGGTLYVWSTNSNLFTCCDCARGAIQSGIKRLVALDPNASGADEAELKRINDTFHFNDALAMYREAGVTVDFRPH